MKLFFQALPASAKLRNHGPLLSFPSVRGSDQGMRSRQEAGWIGRAAIFLAAAVLTACAHRSLPPPSQASVAAVQPLASRTHSQPAPQPISLVQPVPPVEDAKLAHPQSAPPPPTRSEKIALLVKSGRLVAETRSTLTFNRLRPIPVSDTSLYEDAIMLGKLRRKLKEVPDLPQSVLVSATVQDSQACLKFDSDMPLAPLAGAIDAALNTAGVSAVKACWSGAVTL